VLRADRRAGPAVDETDEDETDEDETDNVNIDPEMGDRSRVIGFLVAYVTFILSYGLIIARFSLWGLLFGWLPAAAGAVVAGYVFYRSPLLCLILETIFVALSFWP
jgi:hypothetical protein